MRDIRFINFARGLTSRAQSNGSVGSLNRSRSMLWACSATSLVLGAERRGRIERSMHQTWRFKRVNGTAYPDSIASSLRDTSGAEAAREAALSAQSNGTARGPGSLPESNSAVVNPNLDDRCFRVARQAPSLRGEPPEVDRKIDAPDVELQAYQRYSVSGIYCIDLERRLRR